MYCSPCWTWGRGGGGRCLAGRREDGNRSARTGGEQKHLELSADGVIPEGDPSGKQGQWPQVTVWKT